MAEHENRESDIGLTPELSGQAQNQAAPTPDYLSEDPLEKLLDQESDDDFGLPVFRDHFADELTPAVLKDWSAQDFASIYVRFRPHLERHARRFLNNPTQVEEVVQDAFLYLMTTLPELDSELGVLKFLKWKTRLLALDVIRANSKRYIGTIDDEPELVADLPEANEALERAEDAAIVRLALAKLPPHQREALIATIYEEKSTEVVAGQLGLTENATRQLLFRARSGFKKALVGEAETAGLSLSQILSLAARKAAHDARRVAGAVGAFALLIAIAIGFVPNLATQQQLIADAPGQTQSDSQSQVDGTQNIPTPTAEANGPSGPQASDINDANGTPAPAATQNGDASAATVADQAEATDQNTPIPSPTAEQAATTEPSPQPTFDQASFSTILNTDVDQAGFYENSRSTMFADNITGQSVEIFGGTGISAFMDVDFESRTVRNVVFQMWIEGNRYTAVAKFNRVTAESSASGLTFIHRSAEYYVIDEAGRVFDDSPLARAEATVSLKFNSQGKIISAQLRINN
jgi:RNA polymerase sigma-70 factor (ECF subfamily)